ncbi:hypothetical protein LCGC14_2955980 [marine sediment metagenome]|uniref:Uncharacterized protein n=1 Tax=marine sediment metagenome TaxID=412755 RepID=A0A0F8ZLG4_9ZZZZ
MGKPGEPMSRKEQLERDIEDYSSNPSYNKYIVERAKRELSELKGEVVEPKVEAKPDLTFEQYKSKTVTELRVIAKKLLVPVYYKLNEDVLIKEIMKRH